LRRVSPDDGALSAGAADRLAQAFRQAGRISDAVGRTGPAEFAVFAPATDETGAEGLVQRITDAVSRAAAVKLRAGISASRRRPSARRSSVILHQRPPTYSNLPTELLDRARHALD